MAATVICLSPHAFAQEQTIRGDRLSGYVLPIEPLAGDIDIAALRAASWVVDDTRRLVVEGDVRISIAGQSFTSDAAVVWINRIPSDQGLINQIAVYFDRTSNPTMRAGSGVAGRDLLVTGSTRGQVTLDVGLLSQDRPRTSSLLRTGEQRLAEHLQDITRRRQFLEQRPQVHRQEDPTTFVPVPGGRFEPEAVELPEAFPPPQRQDFTPWLSESAGSIRYWAEQVDIETGEDENTIILIGPLVVEYVSDDPAFRWERLTLNAQRGVIFTDPAPLEDMADGALTVDSIRGIYLEGNVIARANADDYVVRSPRVYYDFRRDQAIMVDSILRTYARQQDMLVYARAREMRQVADNQWTADHVRVSTSEFFTPHLAIGAQRMTITQRPVDERLATAGDPGPTVTHVAADGITLRMVDVPFFYWPRYAATLRDLPLKSINIGSRDEDGVRILTTWNLFTLLGTEEPDGVRADLKLDGYTKRGPGVGIDLRYDVGGSVGQVDLYGLRDRGVDRTSTGRNVDPDREYRGLALWENHWRMSAEWSLQSQLAWISDETFISAWREDDFRDRREYETSEYLKGQIDNNAFTALVKYELNDFISNDYLLASRQYQVDKLPELTYRRYGDSWGDVFTYSTENRVSRVRLVMHQSTPREIGVPGAAFGIGLDDEIDDALRMRGLPTRFVNRADSRHELALPMNMGIFRVVPFATGRVTAYDETFDDLSEDADNVRLFGSVGVTVSTRFQRIDNSVESRVFDLHRMRHIIEPRITAWYGHSTIKQHELPIYDEFVESVGHGSAVLFGLRNIWQTQRGGPGNWRSADVFRLDTDLVLHSENADRQSPSPQFFEHRPEHSQFGDHVRTSMMWLPSDSLSITGEATYDLDEDLVSRGAIGALLRHNPVLTTFVEYRFIEASNNELLAVGWNYMLTPKYRIVLRPQWDLRNDEFRAFTARIARTFPDFDLIFAFRYDRIRDDFSFGALLGLAQF